MSSSVLREPRVGILTDAYPALEETFVYRQVRALASAVACSTRREALIDPEDCPVDSLTKGRPSWGDPRPLLVQRIATRMFGHPAPHWPRATEAAFRLWLRERDVDVLLAQFGPNGIRAQAGCAALDLPLVVQFFGQDGSALLRRPRYVAALPALFAQAEAVVVMGRDMGERLVPHGCPEEKIHVIPVGVPTEVLRASPRVDEQPCRFLAAHRFVPKKGVLETLQAFQRCRQQVPDAKFDLVGGGPLEGDIREFIARHDLGGAVRLHASMPNDVLRERFLQNAACLVQHSRTAPNGDREGWPVVIGEAAACSLPVVATRHAAIPEQVVEGRTGYLVDEGDVAGMADAMARLAADPALRVQMGTAAREHICEFGDLRKQLEALREVLRDAWRAHSERSA